MPSFRIGELARCARQDFGRLGRHLRERTAELTKWSDVVGGSSIGGIWRFE
jgi:hypothetical protein